MRIEAKLDELGLVLPEAARVPPSVQLPFPWVRVHGNRLFVSGHGPQLPDGTIAGPFGKVGAEVSEVLSRSQTPLKRCSSGRATGSATATRVVRVAANRRSKQVTNAGVKR